MSAFSSVLILNSVFAYNRRNFGVERYFRRRREKVSHQANTSRQARSIWGNEPQVKTHGVVIGDRWYLKFFSAPAGSWGATSFAPFYINDGALFGNASVLTNNFIWNDFHFVLPRRFIHQAVSFEGSFPT
jgi:hypothetical protein